MPHRTSNILLVRLTVNEKALLYTFFVRYTLDSALLVVIKIQLVTTLHFLQLHTRTGVGDLM